MQTEHSARRTGSGQYECRTCGATWDYDEGDVCPNNGRPASTPPKGVNVRPYPTRQRGFTNQQLLAAVLLCVAFVMLAGASYLAYGPNSPQTYQVPHK